MSNRVLWGHQQVAVDAARKALWLEGRRGYAFFMEMGTGKTGAAIRTLCERMNESKRLLRTLVFTPPMVVPQWKEEFRHFSQIDPGQIRLLQGSGKQREARFQAGGSVFVTNYESLLMKPLFAAFQEWRPEVLVWDESHRLKNQSALRSKLAWQLANPKGREKPMTYLLTGSPVLNSPMDLFMQYKVMLGGFPAPGYLIDNFFTFRGRYFRDRNSGMPSHLHFPKWEVRNLRQDTFDAVGELNAIVQSTASRVTKDECMDLPEQLEIRVPVGMTPVQAKAYGDMRKNFVAYVNDEACVATMALTKALRLMQITAGFLAVEGEPENILRPFEETPKLKALEELLLDLPGKVLVWAVWKQNYAEIRAMLERNKIRYVEVHGEVSDAKKHMAVEEFTNDPEIKVFLGHPGSGGIGLNLTCATYSIFYSRTFSLEHFQQARARNHRGGQTHKVTHYDLVCGGTLDELILGKLAGKIQISESLLGQLGKELAENPSIR